MAKERRQEKKPESLTSTGGIKVSFVLPIRLNEYLDEMQTRLGVNSKNKVVNLALMQFCSPLIFGIEDDADLDN